MNVTKYFVLQPYHHRKKLELKSLKDCTSLRTAMIYMFCVCILYCMLTFPWLYMSLSFISLEGHSVFAPRSPFWEYSIEKHSGNHRQFPERLGSSLGWQDSKRCVKLLFCVIQYLVSLRAICILGVANQAADLLSRASPAPEERW